MDFVASARPVLKSVLVGAVVIVLLAVWATVADWGSLGAFLIMAILLLVLGLGVELYILRRVQPGPRPAAASPEGARPGREACAFRARTNKGGRLNKGMCLTSRRETKSASGTLRTCRRSSGASQAPCVVTAPATTSP